jgi:hypothetical protein
VTRRLGSMFGLAAAALAAAAACNDPPLALRFRVTDGPASACLGDTGMQLTSCADVTMLCRAVVSIRVFSPDDSTSPYISVCKELTGQPNLCSIAGVDLTEPIQPVTEQTLAVEIVVFPYDSLVDPATGQIPTDPITGELECPTGVQFDTMGFPIASVDPCPPGDPGPCAPSPAVGGIAYYHPGDAQTLVTLGCTDLDQLNNETCSGRNTVQVTATVDDFDTRISVQPTLADRLAVAIGEPVARTVGTEIHYLFNIGDTTAVHALDRTVIQPVPGWSADVETTFVTDACLGVLEDGALTPTTLTCQLVDPTADHLDMTGYRLAKTTLADTLGALGEPQFPADGLVIGIVIDYLGNPVQNQVVTATGGTIAYLSADHHNLIGGGTSSAGIFVSTDAPFGTMFSASTSLQTAVGYGGLVDGKVTVVVLQYMTPTGV